MAMTDPWEDVREELKEYPVFGGKVMRRLLADADALLAVVRLIEWDDGVAELRYHYDAVRDALDSLPEHLK